MRIRLVFLFGILLGVSLSVALNGYTKANAEVGIQFKTNGADKAYVHGVWCEDGRVY